MNNRKTYASTSAKYDLKISKIFEIMKDIDSYLSISISNTRKENPKGIIPGTSNYSKDNKKIYYTQVLDETNSEKIKCFDIAELIVNKNSLTFITHEHPHVLIKTSGLESIAKKYSK